MRGAAAVQRPFRADYGEDDEEQEDSLSDQEKQEKSQRLRDVLVEAVYTIAGRDPKTLLRAPLLTKLMSFYGASLSESDRMLLSLFRQFEEECGQSFAGLVQGWTLPSSQSGGASSAVEGRENTLEALQSLDANVVFATCTEYPRSLSLRKHYQQRLGRRRRCSQLARPGIREAHGCGAALRPGLCVVASRRRHCAGVKLSGLQWVSVFATNAPGLAVCGLSSRCADMRRASLTLVSNLYLAIREVEFQEKDHLVMLLDLLRDALDTTTSIQDDAPTDAPYPHHPRRSSSPTPSARSPPQPHSSTRSPHTSSSNDPSSTSATYRYSTTCCTRPRIGTSRRECGCCASCAMWRVRAVESDWKIFKRRRTWELLASV